MFFERTSCLVTLLSVDPSHRTTIKFTNSSFFLTVSSNKYSDIANVKVLQAVSFSCNPVKFTPRSFSISTWDLRAVNGRPYKAILKYISCSVSTVSWPFSSICCKPVAMSEFSGMCSSARLGGKEIPAATASECCFSRIAHWWRAEESWSLMDDNLKFVLPFKKLIITFSIERNISSCEQHAVQIVFWFSVILNQPNSLFHFFQSFFRRKWHFF